MASIRTGDNESVGPSAGGGSVLPNHFSAHPPLAPVEGHRPQPESVRVPAVGEAGRPLVRMGAHADWVPAGAGASVSELSSSWVKDFIRHSTR